jgi:hypothetical protein
MRSASGTAGVNTARVAVAFGMMGTAAAPAKAAPHTPAAWKSQQFA